MNIAKTLKQSRITKGYSMSQVAELAGIPRTTYSGYEHGTRKPNLETLAKLITVLDIDANDLFRDEDSSRTINAYVME